MAELIMLSDYSNKTDGNVAMMFAIVLGMIGIGLGVAIDGSKMMSVNSRATAVADAAALAGASATENNFENREEVVRAYIEANAFKISPAVMAGNPVIVFDDTNEVVTVEIPTTVKLAFGGFLGANTKPVRGVSQATYLKNNIDPVTIAFALDVSGSMQWDASDGQPKIDVLKSATKSLFSAIEAGTDRPEKLKKALRSGMSAYNTELVSSQSISWGWNSVEMAVGSLPASGGTNSTPALQNSYDQLLNDRSFRASNNPKFNLERLREYVIFMTDGDNNQPVFDEESSKICQKMRESGIEIYSVAFEAPEKGELLLVDCASPNVAEKAGQSPKDDSKCLNGGKKGKGKALGHCKKDKSKHFFDANNAAAFEAAFKEIGEDIVRSNVRLN